MNLRGRLFTFIASLLILCMIAATLLVFKFSERMLIDSNFDNLSQARTNKSLLLKSEIEKLSLGINNLAGRQQVSQALLELEIGKNKLLDWLSQQTSIERSRKELSLKYSASKDPETLGYINRLGIFPIFIQSQFIKEAIKRDSIPRDVASVNDYAYFDSYHKYFPLFYDFALSHKLNDIILVDKSGVVVFSINKELDLGANLIRGQLKSSILGEAFRWALNVPAGTVKFFDFNKNTIPGKEPISALAAPVFRGDSFIGTVIVKISADTIDRILSNHYDWSNAGLKKTGEIVLFGRDGLLRSNSRLLQQAPEAFAKKAQAMGLGATQIKNILDRKSAVLQIGIPPEEARRFLDQDASQEVGKNYLGVISLRSISRMTLPGGEQWVIIANASKAEILAPLWRLLKILTATFLGLLLFSIIFSYFYSKRFISPLKDLAQGFSDLEYHHFSKKIVYSENNEIGVLVRKFNKLSKMLETTTVSKNFLDSVVQSINELLIVVQINYNPETETSYLSVTDANRAAAETIGTSTESLKGTDLKIWLEVDHNLIMAPPESSGKSQTQPHVEGFIKCLSAERIPVKISWAPIQKNSIGTDRLVIVCSDLRWQKNAEAEIRLRENMIKESQALSKVGSFHWDIKTGKNTWSEEIFHILGLPKNTIPSQKIIRSLIATEEVTAYDRVIDQAQKSMAPLSIDIRIRKADTQEVACIRYLGKIEYDSYGDAVSMFGTLQDVTEIKRTELALVAAKNEALKSSQAKSEFLAHMSHEIRTPMNSIMGMAELLKETKLTKDQEYYVNIFWKAGEVLMTLINDILDLSKIEAGEVSIENIPFDLQKILDDVHDIVKQKIHDKGLTISFDLGPGVSTKLMGDPAKIRQVLINLVGNSVKFTERGYIRVNVVKNPTKKDGLIFSVSDSGLGIPASKQGLIFQKFSQADSSISRKFGGTGLGLAISKSLVELMGGQIWFKSKENIGTTFFFTTSYREQVLNPVTQESLQMQAKNLDFEHPQS